MTVIGSGYANSAMRSASSLVRRLPMSSSTISRMRVRSASTARGVKALVTSDRKRVWSGGSIESMKFVAISPQATAPASA